MQMPLNQILTEMNDVAPKQDIAMAVPDNDPEGQVCKVSIRNACFQAVNKPVECSMSLRACVSDASDCKE